MGYTVSKDHSFSASHVLLGLPEGHPCGRLHGHNFTVRLTLAASHLDDVGFVIDYNELRPFFTLLDTMFDHRHLNDVVDFNPTSERMAAYLFDLAESSGLPVVEVGWSETGKTWATYRKPVDDESTGV